jgi:hypothetical protein
MFVCGAALTRLLLAFVIGVLAAPVVGLVAGYVLEYYKPYRQKAKK